MRCLLSALIMPLFMPVVSLGGDALCFGNKAPGIDVDYSSDELNLWELFGPPSPQDYLVIDRDTIRFDFKSALRAQPLNDRDYVEVARELGVEVAAIKAVVEVETGRTCRGFNSDATPVINFDFGVFRSFAARRHIHLSRYSKSHSVLFSRQGGARSDSPQRIQHARFAAAMDIDSVTAIEATFWGMFQIGGFNWKRCGAKSPYDFVELMSRNERDQLDLFAAFIRSCNLLKYLREKNWSAFARLYNGPSFAVNAYHTRLERAYKKYLVN